MERKVLLDKIDYYAKSTPDAIALEAINKKLTYLEFKNQIDIVF